MASLFQQYQDAYKGHPKEVWTLTVLTFINRMGTMVLPFLTVYLTTVRGFSLQDAGLLAAAFGVGAFGGAYTGGKLSDKWSPQTVIILSLSISGILLICLQWAEQFHSLFLLIAITAFFGEAYRPAMSSAIGSFVPKSQTGRSMALIRLAINLGMAAGPAIGGFVAASMGYQWLFWMDGLTCIAGALYFWVKARQWQPKEKTEEASEAAVEDTPALRPWQNTKYVVFLLATLIMGIGFVQWFHSVPVFLKSEWGFDERYIGMLMGMGSVMIVLIEMPLTHTIEKAGKINGAMLIGMGLIGTSFLPLLLTKAFILAILAMFLFTLGEILVLPFNGAIPLNMSPDNRRGEYMAWYWMTWSLVVIIGPAVGLKVADAIGFEYLWVGMVALLGVSLVLKRLTIK